MALHVVTALGLLIFVWEKKTFGGTLSAGLFVVVFQYLRDIEGAVRGFGEKHQQLLNYKVDFSSIDEIEAAYAEYGIKTDITAPDWHTAQVENITFRYEDQEHHTHRLDGVTLDLARGRKIALVGESGAGKSTLLRLLRGLHEPLAGSLTIDNAKAEFATLAAGSTLVPQDAEIFENTLRYNITCGVAEDADRLKRAVAMAALPPVLADLPLGLDTDIRERGVNLSGGQKQRLALARGLYAAADSSLLLLDEPTSSLDPATEAEVFNRLLAGFPEACIVASLHRLHLLDRFDHVYVMAEGKVVEQGSFAELLAAQGVFYRLWQAQAKEQ
jgi:ATP-binding cassette subfamily B protein